MKQLIVVADDFGLTKSVNEGIVKAYREGIVTYLSLMPTGEAFEDAVGLSKALKLEEIGAHLSLTETNPSCKSHKEFFIRLLAGAIDRGHIYNELKGQLEKLKNANIGITNLSSHEHIHMMPAILDIFIRLAKEYDIPSIRYPHGDRNVRRFEFSEIYRRLILSSFGKRVRERLQDAAIVHTDHFLGFLDSGRLREDMLIDMLKSLKEGTTELVCHPGFLGPEILDRYRFHINCEEELFALTSPRVKKLIKEKEIKLISYQEFL